MDKKKLLFLGGGAVIAIVALIVGLSFIGKEPTEENIGGPAANINTDLTDAEKIAISATTTEFLAGVGNYGWYPDLVKNPQVSSNQSIDDYFYSEEHSTVDDTRAVLRKVSNSTAFDRAVNVDAYNAPFAVESEFMDDIVVPNRPIAEGSKTIVVVTVPVKSTLSYISTTTASFDENMVESPSVTTVEVRTFEGNLTLNFSKDSGKWVVSNFESDLGVLATDSFFVVNGDLIVEATAVKTESFLVN